MITTCIVWQHNGKFGTTERHMHYVSWGMICCVSNVPAECIKLRGQDRPWALCIQLMDMKNKAPVCPTTGVCPQSILFMLSLHTFEIHTTCIHIFFQERYDQNSASLDVSCYTYPACLTGIEAVTLDAKNNLWSSSSGMCVCHLVSLSLARKAV